MPTIREILKDNELNARADDNASSRFDAPVEIARTGDVIAIPKKLRPEKALEMVSTWVTSESETTSVRQVIDGVPIDVAHALMLAVKYEYGVVHFESGFWGSPPPHYSVPTSVKGDNVDVYVGTFTLPGFEGASFSTAPTENNMGLTISALLRKKDLPLLKQLIETTKDFLMKASLYRGKAIEVDFGNMSDDSGGESSMLLPKFWDISEEQPLILQADTETMIRATLWTPIEATALVREMGTPIKRTILLHGIYGTGKTLTAYRTAQIAVNNGFTFVYVRKVENLQMAIDFISSQFLPAVLFMEDTEKAFENPEKINILQNTLDGINTKNRDLIIVLTSNHVEQLPAAILRPGRLDSVIRLSEADPDMAARLVKLYAGEMLDSDADMAAIGAITAGNIPATIREFVERSKLFALARVKNTNFTINHEDISLAVRGMEEHMALLKGNKYQQPSPVAILGTTLGAQIAQGVRDGMAAVVTGSAFSDPQVQ